MKQCQTCRATLPLDRFARNGPTRLKPDCKACYKANRRNWKTRGGENGRERAGQKTRELYARNPGAHRKENVRTKARNPDKRRARLVVAMRIYRGTLIRPTKCERCGIECKPEAHHHDYAKPLDVEWLCKPCHRIAGMEVAPKLTHRGLPA
jgi:hypothetical protein